MEDTGPESPRKRAKPGSSAREHGHLGGLLAGKIGSNKYVVDYAVDARSKCRFSSCKRAIPQHALRLGKIPPAFKTGQAIRTQWFHVECLFESFQRTCKNTKTITSVDDIQGFDKLKVDDQRRITDCISKATAVPFPMVAVDDTPLDDNNDQPPLADAEAWWLDAAWCQSSPSLKVLAI